MGNLPVPVGDFFDDPLNELDRIPTLGVAMKFCLDGKGQQAVYWEVGNGAWKIAWVQDRSNDPSQLGRDRPLSQCRTSNGLSVRSLGQRDRFSDIRAPSSPTPQADTNKFRDCRFDLHWPRASRL